MKDVSYVYLMKNLTHGYYKIGISNNPRFRETTLQAEEPDVRLLASIPGDRALEAKFHSDFEKYRVRGEWFRLEGLPLWNLAESFGVAAEVIDPPSESIAFAELWILNIHRYGGGRAASRILSQQTRRLQFAAGYALTTSEAQEELDATFFSVSVDDTWHDHFLRTSFACRQIDSFEPGRIELLELRCLSTSTVRAYYAGGYGHETRIFAEERYARRVFDRIKRDWLSAKV